MLPLITRIDLSGLSVEQAVDFEAWLAERPHLQARLQVALSQGQAVTAGLSTHRKQVEYTVRLAN